MKKNNQVPIERSKSTVASEKKLAVVEEDYKSAKNENEKDIVKNLDKKPAEETEPVEEEKLKALDRFLEMLWPVRGKYRSEKDTGELFIKTNLRSLVVYLIFVALISIIIYGMVGSINYYFSVGMLSLFVDAPINPDQPQMTQKTFRGNSMVKIQDAWDFLRGPLLDGLYWEIWFDGSNTTPSNLGYIFYENKILGKVRILQMRVQNNSCSIPSSMKSMISKCGASYSSSMFSTFSTEMTQPFGLGLNDPTNNLTAWHYTKDSNTPAYLGQISSYPGNGYAVLLADYKNESLAILNDLYNNLWIDDKTRAIIVDFTVYNANINLFNQMRLIMEFPATGGVMTSWIVRTSKLLRYVSPFDYGIALCELFFLIFIVYFTIGELVDLRYRRWKYFKQVFNLLDLLILGLCYGTVGLSFYRTVSVNNILDQLLLSGSQFQSFERLTYVQELFNQFCAVIIFLAWIKVFKFINMNKALVQLTHTCGHAGKDLFYFMLNVALFMTAYATLGYLFFGDLHPDYKDFFRTYFTLFRLMLGSFDFKGLQSVSPIMGPIFFVSYVILSLFVLLNMFLAIINNAYGSSADKLEKKDPELMLSDFMKSRYGKLADKFARRNKMLDAEEILDMEEVLESENGLEFTLWRQEMKRRGYADMEIETFFAKYDLDRDQVMSFKEQVPLRRDIKKAKSHLEEKFQKDEDNKDNDGNNDDEDNHNNDDFDEDDTNPAQRLMNRDDFDYVLGRIDRMELSVASVVNKIDKLFDHLEEMERDKIIKRKEMAKLLQDSEEQARISSMDFSENIGPIL